MIKKEGGEWCLYNKAGTKKLGCHPSKKKAQEQEVAVHMAKAQRKGKAGGGPVSKVKKAEKKAKSMIPDVSDALGYSAKAEKKMGRAAKSNIKSKSDHKFSY